MDASVAIKWFIPEIHAIEASRLLQKQFRFIAPDIFFAEVSNILWKKNRLKELSIDIATEIFNDFQRMPIDKYDSESLLSTAWAIATKQACTIYDSLYVALAKTEKCVLVTADRALYNSLRKTDIARTLLWIENIKAIT